MNFKNLTKIIHKTISFFTLVSTVSLLASFMFSFDAINGYFTDGILPVVFKTVFNLGIVFSLASPFAFDRHKIIKSAESFKKHSVLYIIFASVLALCSTALNVLSQNTYFVISSIGACFFAVYVFLLAAKEGRKYSHAKLICLLLSSLFPIAMIFDNYSVLIRHSNSVENTLTAVFGIAFLTYILYEGNRLFTGVHSRWHFASMLLLSHSGISLSAAYVIAYFTKDVTEAMRFYQMILILIISIFAEIELLSYTRKADSLTKEEWNELEAPKESSEETAE